MLAINNARRVAKAANKAILTDLCNTIDTEKRKRNLTMSDRIPDMLVHRLVTGIKNVCPHITRHTITNEYRRRKRLGIFYYPTTNTDGQADAAGTDIIPAPVVTPPRTKGGRPEGSTSKRRKHYELSEIAAKNEIVTMFEKKRKEAGTKRLKRGYLDEIIETVKQKNNLQHITISKQCIRQRLKPEQNAIVVNSHPGHSPPLADIEQDVVLVMIQMAQLRQCVTPSQAIQLINGMIKGTDAQRRLIAWKRKNSSSNSGEVGSQY